MIRFRLPRIKLPNPLRGRLRFSFWPKKTLLNKKERRRLTWKRFGLFCLYGFSGFVLLSLLMFAWFARDLPTPGKIRNLSPDASTRLFDRNMNPLYTISGEQKRILVNSEDIPEIVRQATIALEDRNFYNHIGLDVHGVARAIVFRGERGGGSTITQQFVKNALLDDRRRTVTRKIREAILAVQLEILYSKDEILTMYLNEISYGGNNYGIEAASRSFFGKSAKELTLVEAATLAALPQAPTTLSPHGPNTDRLIARRNFTLDRMVEEGFITSEQAEEAKAQKLSVIPRRDSITAPHFVLYTKEWLVNHFEHELNDRQLAERRVESGGLKVVTTLDLPKQKIAEEVVANHVQRLNQFRASNAALVTIDPRRGDIIAMVGSIDYFNESFGAFNVTTALRQPGSAFKSIVYAAAFKERFNPATTIFDLPTDFGGGYRPENADLRYRGPITIRNALGLSLNIPAAKVGALVGIDRVLSTATDLGITTLTDKERYGLSLMLGANEIRPIELTSAYGVFANNGVLVPHSPVLTITDSQGREVYNRTEPKDARQVLDPMIAYQISNVLADANAKRPVFGGMLRVLTLSDRPAATKTGTTDYFRDAWMFGYTPQFVTGVWAGNNDFSTMTAAGGAMAAAPIWDEFMERIHQGLPVENFTRPAGIREVTVDRLSNRLPVEGSEPITDIFAPWQVPRERDNIRRQVRVCRENGLLAGDDIPDELAMMRTFTFVQSEKPDNPNWELPVRRWAAGAGLDNRPPTERCVIGEINPTIRITSPEDGSIVSGNFIIRAEATAPSGVAAVDFSLNETIFFTDTEAPFETSYNANQLASGQYTVGATVRSVNGSTAVHRLTVRVDRDTSPPGEVRLLNGLSGPGRVNLSWVNPDDADLKLVRVTVIRDTTGAVVQTVEVPVPQMSLAVTGLISGQAYRFTVRTVDVSNNASNGQTIILTPL